MQSLLLLLSLASQPGIPATATVLPTVEPVTVDDLKAEYEKRREEADGDVQKLWSVVNWCEANSMEKERRSCLRAILKLDDDDKKAHELLGHVYYDGRWFTTEKKLETYKKKEAERIAKEQGLVPYKDGYAHPDDIPYLEKGLTKTDDGRWVDAEQLKRIEEGWRQQDLVWISPDEFEKADAGLYKCGEEWLSEEDANAYHSELGKWWGIPGNYFNVFTTLPRNVAIEARDVIDGTFRDLTRIYGVTPSEPLSVVLLRSVDQYSTFAAGQQGVWPGTDILGLSSVHGAFFADGLIDYDARKWNGAGSGYWDFSSDSGTQFGRTFARHAAGQSFAEYVDPSPKAVRKFEGSAQEQFPIEDFYTEKKLPMWFRYGAAAYVERYYIDPYVGEGGDKFWARNWSISNIASKGGLDQLSRIFEFSIGPDNPDSGKLINQAGLLVAFIIDGDSPAVKKEHGAVKAALRGGKDPKKAFEGLEKALEKHEDELKKFADL